MFDTPDHPPIDQVHVPALPRLTARISGVGLPAGFLLIGAAVLTRILWGESLPDAATVVQRVASVVGAVLLVLGVILQLLRPVPDVTPRLLASPIRGRWVAVNSPASKIPSHGTHGYGQTFAVDLVLDDPEQGAARPLFGTGAHFRESRDYPAFGRLIHAPVDGKVVRATGRARDHRARSSYLAVGYLMGEAALRELMGPTRILGNHLIVDAGDGSFVALAHLRQGSLLVAPGDRVKAGQPVAECGNSGNSSEPHLHVQVMDDHRPALAVGLPMAFSGAAIDDLAGPGLPANGAAMVV